MNPIAKIRALWGNPKSRPWLLGGAGATAGVAYLALRRSADPLEAAAEDNAAASAYATDPVTAGPTTIEGPGTYGEAGIVGALPIVVGGSGYGTPDPAFTEMDLSGLYAELDAVAVQQQDALDAAVADQRTIRQQARRAGKQAQRAQERVENQRERIKKQNAQIKRTNQRVRRLENKVERATPPRSVPRAPQKGRVRR